MHPRLRGASASAVMVFSPYSFAVRRGFGNVDEGCSEDIFRLTLSSRPLVEYFLRYESNPQTGLLDAGPQFGERTPRMVRKCRAVYRIGLPPSDAGTLPAPRDLSHHAPVKTSKRINLDECSVKDLTKNELVRHEAEDHFDTLPSKGHESRRLAASPAVWPHHCMSLLGTPGAVAVRLCMRESK
ncbi:hypothetical protein PSPO01_15697 [Paraphaeosphaeria sporulosa]